MVMVMLSTECRLGKTWADWSERQGRYRCICVQKLAQLGALGMSGRVNLKLDWNPSNLWLHVLGLYVMITFSDIRNCPSIWLSIRPSSHRMRRTASLTSRRVSFQRVCVCLLTCAAGPWKDFPIQQRLPLLKRLFSAIVHASWTFVW